MERTGWQQAEAWKLMQELYPHLATHPLTPEAHEAYCDCLRATMYPRFLRYLKLGRKIKTGRRK